MVEETGSVDFGHVLIQDLLREEVFTNCDFIKADDIKNSEGQRIGFESTVRESYYRVKIVYNRVQKDYARYRKDSKFEVNY